MSAILNRETTVPLHKTKCPRCRVDIAPQASACHSCKLDLKARTHGQAVKATESNRVPGFAELSGHVATSVNPALQQELAELKFLFFRERVFLSIHWGCFLLLNLTGFALALKCYFGVFGDEGTKLALALIPMFYINLCALVFLSYIKNTRQEMRHLNQKISYVRFKIEYGTLL